MEDTSTISTTYESNYGVHVPPAPPDLSGVDLNDLESLGMNFEIVTPPPAPAPAEAEADDTEETTETVVADSRTSEDLQAAARSTITNVIDIDEDMAAVARLALQSRTREFSSFVLEKVVPTVLAVQPALERVKRSVPSMFSNSADIDEVEMPVAKLANYAANLGVVAAQVKLIEMFDLPNDVRDRLLARLLPEPTRKEPSNGTDHNPQ